MRSIVVRGVLLCALAVLAGMSACSGNQQTDSTLSLKADRQAPFTRGEAVTLIATATDRNGKAGTGDVRFRADMGTFGAAATAERDTTVTLSNGVARIDLLCGDECPQTVGVSATWSGNVATYQTLWTPPPAGGGNGADAGDGGEGADGGDGGDGGNGGFDASYPLPNCDTFNPDHVYLVGSVLSPNVFNVYYAQFVKDLDVQQNIVCPGWDPRQTAAGKEIVFAIRPLSQDIVYVDKDGDKRNVHVHVNDPLTYSVADSTWHPSPTPESNDPALFDAGAVCGGSGFTIDALKAIPGTDDVLYFCAGGWWRNTDFVPGLTVNDLPVWPGTNGDMLAFGYDPISTGTHVRVVHPDGGASLVNDRPDGGFGIGEWTKGLVRATADGFLMVYRAHSEDGGMDDFQQWATGLDGSTTLNGSYVQIAGFEQLNSGGVLDKNGDIVAPGLFRQDAGVEIVRFSLTNPPTAIFQDTQIPSNWAVTPPVLNLWLNTPTEFLEPLFCGP